MTKFTMSQYRSQADLYAAMQDRIRKLQEALRAIERHNDNPAHYDSHINKLCMEALGEDK